MRRAQIRRKKSDVRPCTDPHVYPEDRWLFLTWHLESCLPLGAYPTPGHLKGGEAFAWMDRFLDSARNGPSYLGQTAVAQVVRDALWKGRDREMFDLGAYALMPNHVHVLWLPKVAPLRLLRSLKGASPRQANLIPGRSGHPLWDRESYDDWVRSQAEWNRIAAYIENNPVRAELVRSAEEYAWSSASAAGPERLSEDGSRNAATAH